MEINENNLELYLRSHLKTKHINNDIEKLWGETRSWFKNNMIEFGGGYASEGKDISIRTHINNENISFKIKLMEV